MTTNPPLKKFEFTNLQKNIISGTLSPMDFTHPHGCGKPGCLVCFASDNLLVNPHCEHCNGIGFVYPVNYAGKPVYRQAVPCKEPGCYAENWAMREETLTREQTFATFDMKRANQAYDIAMRFANEEGLRLFIHFGMYGCGKTHLLNAIYNHRVAQGWPVKKYAMNELFNRMIDAMGSESVESKFAEAASCEMLLLDDIDMALLTDWKLDRLKELIDYRIQNNLWTHITTHNSLSEIEAKSPALDDRFGDMQKCVLVFNGAKSYRTAK